MEKEQGAIDGQKPIDHVELNSSALQELQFRGFLKQCTDIQKLDEKASTETLTLYVGIDPTGPSLHVGHIVPLFAMAHLAKAGHKVVVLIGGGTAQIGDPSGKTEMRKMLTPEVIGENSRLIGEQINAFFYSAGIPEERVSVLNNKDWLLGLNYIEFLRDIGKHFSVNRMLTFETYKQRLETGLSFIEFNYQLLQSYDFLVLNRDHGVNLQIGGDDQWGNIVAGIDLIRRVSSNEAYGLTFPLVTRADGKKMGKSEKGAIFLDPELCPPFELFQYWRNTSDADVVKFLKLFTFLSRDRLKELESYTDQRINEAKEILAFEYTKLIHGSNEAEKALDSARALFSGGGFDTSSVPNIEIGSAELEKGIGIMDLFARTGLCSSKGDARRLVTQGGAKVNDEVIVDIESIITSEQLINGEILLKAGKKRYFRVISVDSV